MKRGLPGHPVRGSKSGRPIMALLDLLGRRNALRILWELRERPLNFRQLQAESETNPSVLNTRLGELRDARIVELSEAGYRLTARGERLVSHLMPLARWSQDWARALDE